MIRQRLTIVFCILVILTCTIQPRVSGIKRQRLKSQSGTLQSVEPDVVSSSIYLESSVSALPTPLGYYQLNKNKKFTDTSGNANHGILTNTTSINQAFVNDIKYGTAWKRIRSNTNDVTRITLPFDLPNSYTKICSINVYTRYSMHIISSNSIAPGLHTLGVDGGGYLRAGHGPITSSSITTWVNDKTSPIPLNEWIHIAVTFDATTKNFNLYRDSTLVASVIDNTSGYTGGTRVSIGNHGSTIDYSLAGMIRNVRIYNVALTTAQITKLMSDMTSATIAPPTIPPPSLPTLHPLDTIIPPQAYYPLTRDTQFTDLTMNKQNGVITNAASTAQSFVEDILYGSAWKRIRTTTNDPVRITLPFSLAQSYTKALWVNVASLYGQHWISSNTITTGLHALGLSSSGYLRAGHSKTNSIVDWLIFPVKFPLNRWVQVVETYDANSKIWTLYQDGQQVATKVDTSGYVGGTQIAIGNHGSTTDVGLIGTIRNIRLYNVALTATQIQDLYLSAPTLPPTPTSPPIPIQASTPTPTVTLDSEEIAFLDLINTFRASQGVGPLVISKRLTDAADWLAVDCATHNGGSHWDSYGRDAGTRMEAFGYTTSRKSENVYVGGGTAAAAFNGWVNMYDGHRQNMHDGSWTAIGVGRAYGEWIKSWYWVTDFGAAVDQQIYP